MHRLALLFCFALGLAQAQDEKFIRQILTQNLKKNVEEGADAAYHWQVHSGAYNFDLDNDGLQEKFYLSKKDGQDWITLLDYTGKKIFEKKLQAKGHGSVLYKIRLVSLSPAHKALLLHFYEGHSSFVNTYGSARFYFITWDNNNLDTLAMFEGPSFFDEEKLGDKHYHRREYKLNVYDYNRDGIKEVSVRFNLIERIYFYQGKGQWGRM